MGFPALLILLECCILNIYAADRSWFHYSWKHTPEQTGVDSSVQYWTGEDENISDFQYSLHFFKIFYYFCHITYYSVQYWTGEDEKISDFQYSLYFFKIFHYFCHITYYSVQYWTDEDEYISDFQCLLHFKIFCYFCHIFLFSIELRNMSMFQDHEVCHSSAVIFFCFSYIIKSSLNLVDNSVFQILRFHHTNEIDNKWKPFYTWFIIH
jgi:hypothetical protein